MNRLTQECTPIIDVGSLFGSSPGPCVQTDRAIARALETQGSFVARGAWPGIDRQASRLCAFFRMANDSKESCAVSRFRPENPNIYRGYYPMTENESWSRRESFDVGPEPPMTSPDVPGAESFREPNIWPGDEPWPGWRKATLAMLNDLRDVGVTLLAAVSRGLGLDEDVMVSPARGRNATLRFLHGDVAGTEPARVPMSSRPVTSIPVFSPSSGRAVSAACRCRDRTGHGARCPSLPTGCRFIAVISWKCRATADCGPRRTRFWAGRIPTGARWESSSNPISKRSSHHRQASR